MIRKTTHTIVVLVLLLPMLLSLTGCLTPLRQSQPAFSVKPSASAIPPRRPSSHLTAPSAASSTATANTVRGQGPTEYFGGRPAVQAAGYQAATGRSAPGQVQPVQYNAPSPEALWGIQPQSGVPAAASPYGSAPSIQQPAAASVPPASFPGQAGAIWGDGSLAPVGPPTQNPGVLGLPSNLADIIVNVQEAQTGRFMVGAAVNSDAGVTGQITIDERNFDWRAFPRSFDDVLSGGVFRGAGQGLRVEALPGSQVQRYMIQFTNPYLFNTRISMNLSGYLFDRQFFDWDEQRLGGRFGLGYRVSPDMSLSATLRAEQVEISNPRNTFTNPAFDPNLDPADPLIPPTIAVPALDRVLGDSDLFSARFSLIQDTRDIPFQPTQGYYFEAAFEQVFGSFNYSRFDLDLRRYFLLAQRPDGSGRHTLGFSNKLGISGEETPVFENYFAGGFATLRGFDFRRASPQDTGVTIGGRLQFLGSAEYIFPITADDMVKGIAFVDYGTVEEDINIESEDFRVAVGMGLRVNIPALGAAPIALDFAVPIAREETDEIRSFSFSMGLSR